MESAMPRTNPWSNSVPRVEIDHRAREARLRIERIEQLFVRSQAKRSWLRSVLFGLRLGGSRYRLRAGQNTGPLRPRQPRQRRIHRASRRFPPAIIARYAARTATLSQRPNCVKKGPERGCPTTSRSKANARRKVRV